MISSYLVAIICRKLSCLSTYSTVQISGSTSYWFNNGFEGSIISLYPESKRPIYKNWGNRPYDRTDYYDYNRGVGILTKYYPTVDIDIDDPELASNVQTIVTDFLGVAPMRYRNDSPRRAIMYRTEVPFKKIIIQIDSHKVEILGDGQQVFVDGTHPDGEQLRWTQPPIANQLPLVTEETMLTLARKLHSLNSQKNTPSKLGENSEPNFGRKIKSINLPLDHILTLAGGDTVTVEELISDPETYHLSDMYDPLEPDYGGGQNIYGGGQKNIARAYLDQPQPIIHSFAHSNRNFVLPPLPLKDPISIERDPPPPFPIQPFQGWFGDMINEVSAFTETPRELASMIGLTMVATATHNKFVIEVKEGYREPLSLWSATVLDPSNRKSAVMALMHQPIINWEREKSISLAPKIARILEQNKRSENRIKELNKELSKVDDRKEYAEITEKIDQLSNTIEEEPISPKMWGEDITPESLATQMEVHNECFALLSAEGGMFDIMSGERYSRKIPNFDIYLKGHAGDSVRVDRTGRESVFMENPALTIGVAIQHRVLESLVRNPEFEGRGMIARTLFTIPESTLGKRRFDGPNIQEKTLNDYIQKVKILLDIDYRVNDSGNVIPRPITLSAEGAKFHHEFSLAIEQKMREGRELSHMTSWAGKLPGAVARISGLLHCIKHVDVNPSHKQIDLHTMKMAVTIGENLMHHATHVYDIAAGGSGIYDAKVVWGWILRLRKRSLTASECQQANRSKFPKAADIEPAFEALVRHRYLIELPRDGTRGRPSRHYDVHPSILADWDAKPKDQ